MRNLARILSLTFLAGWAVACETDVDAGPTGIEVVPSMAKGGAHSGGGECCLELQHPIIVTFADRSDDSWTSDGGGPYTDSQHMRVWLSDFIDEGYPDRFVFIANGESEHPILLDIPGVFSGPCSALDAGIHAPDETPDMYHTPVGWSGPASRSNISCGLAHTFPRTRVQILDCVVVTHAAQGRWHLAANECQATVSSVDRRGNETFIGEYPASYEFVAEEVG